MKSFSICLLAVSLCIGSAVTLASDLTIKTVAEVYQEKDSLKGQQVQIRGKIVKVNNQIMNRNFLHIQDGTGKEGSNDLTVTSQDTAMVADEVIITGTVSLNVDFGSGYMYPLLIEKATITKAK